MTRSLAIVGGGPRTVGLLERLAANADELFPCSRLTVHIIEPCGLGGGRVWRPDQSPLLWMNSRAGEVTMFTDETVLCAGPIRPGPTLHEWATMAPDDFPSRRTAAGYLEWCLNQATMALPPNVDVRMHRAAAVALTENGRGRQVVALSTGDSVGADLVVLAQGNLDGGANARQPGYAEIARRSGGVYLSPGYTADLDLSGLPAGEPVLVSGLGLAFIDFMVLLTEGRGGAFVRRADGTLRYEPSGAEPLLLAGSRRGVPYLPKPDLRRYGPAPRLPRFVDPNLTGPAMWDAIRKELGWGFYHELFSAHPSRTTMRWAEFACCYADLSWDSAGMRALVERAVPDPGDRLEPSRVVAPLARLRFAGAPELDRWLRNRLLWTVRRATSPRHSAWAGAFHALMAIADALTDALSGPVEPMLATTFGRFGELARIIGSGPPPHRLEQLAALSSAGVVRFLGSNLRIEPDRERRIFLAHTDSVPGSVPARHFVEARLPDPDIRSDPLLGGLLRDGSGVASGGRLVVDPDSFQVLGANGKHHARRIAFGAFATAGRLGSFSRPFSNAPFFRQNDRVARWILSALHA